MTPSATGEAEVSRVEHELPRRVGEVEHGRVADSLRAIGSPHHSVPLAEHLAVAARFPMHLQHVGVGEQCDGLGQARGKVTADHERRPGNHPEGEQRDALVLGEPVVSRFAPFGTDADATKGQHVAVRPSRLRRVRRPPGEPREVRLDVIPAVPEVVADAPHRRVLAQVFDASERQVAPRRQAQFDRPSAALDGKGIRLDVTRLVRPEHVVGLDEVDAPVGVEPQRAVVVRLCGGVGVIEAGHIGVPLAHVAEVGHRIRRDGRAENRRATRGSEPRDATHRVDAEPQPERVHRRRERPESRATR